MTAVVYLFDVERTLQAGNGTDTSVKSRCVNTKASSQVKLDHVESRRIHGDSKRTHVLLQPSRQINSSETHTLVREPELTGIRIKSESYY